LYKTVKKRVLVKADLNQIELRVLAAIIEDENMLEVFRSGGDLHINTAETITGRKVKKGDPERQRAKAVNFGLSFGMGAKRFLEKARNDYGVEMTLEEAREAKRKLLEAYPDIGLWHQREAAESERGNFETYTLMGRRRVVEPDHTGKPKFTERLNAPAQGTAADILKLAMARLWEARGEHPNAFVVLTVHDEVVIECEAQEAPGIARWLGDTLRKAVADVLGYEELAGEDAVETTVIEAWGRYEGYIMGSEDSPGKGVRLTILGWMEEGSGSLLTILRPWEDARGASGAYLQRALPVAVVMHQRYEQDPRTT
jgi:DNA polymerase I